MMKTDPRYVKTLARIWSKTDGVQNQKILDYHVCTSEDWKEFYPVAEKSKQLFDEIEQGEGRGFYCFDWNDDFEIYGDETQDSKYVEIFLLPCNYLHQKLGNKDDYEDSISEECIWDL